MFNRQLYFVTRSMTSLVLKPKNTDLWWFNYIEVVCMLLMQPSLSRTADNHATWSVHYWPQENRSCPAVILHCEKCLSCTKRDQRSPTTDNPRLCDYIWTSADVCSYCLPVIALYRLSSCKYLHPPVHWACWILAAGGTIFTMRMKPHAAYTQRF